ncbi:MAG: gliding motility-associated C-terminal domain-containing protein, partial [Flammeovirgaceae bacterium]
MKKVSGLKFLVTINVYTNTGSPVKLGDGKLNFGDEIIHTLPTQESTSFAPDIGFVSYSIEHTYQKSGQYTISYIEKNLESGTLNIVNSINTPFYLETSAYLD